MAGFQNSISIEIVISLALLEIYCVVLVYYRIGIAL